MCTPAVLFATSLFISAAGGAAQYIGQRQQAQAQTQMAEANAKSAAGSFRLQQAQLQSQLLQQRSQVEQQDSAQAIEAERLRASARVSGAEAGVSGVSLDAILMQTGRERSNQATVNQRNFQTLQQDELNKEGQAYFDMKNRINSVAGGVFPSLATPILNTAGAGLQAYGSYLYKPGK